MKKTSYTCTRFVLGSLLLGLMLLFFTPTNASAQWELKWLSVGEMHKYYTEAGSHNEDYQGHNIHWPGIRNEHGNVRGYALWIAVQDFTDENGMEWPVKIAHVGPRITGLGEVFAEDFSMISRFEPPLVEVDGFETFNRPVFNDEVDPSMAFDRSVYTRTGSVVGITQERWSSQFSQEHHDNYHILEFVFTNTGNTDDDEQIELPDQTLDGVYFYWQNRYAPNRSAGWEQNNAQGWGKWTMNDTVGDGHEDYNVDFRAQWSWLGHVTTLSGRTALGGPLWNDGSWLVASGDSTGRLGAAHMLGRMILHADKSATDESDDPEQPSTMNFIWTGDERTHLNEHTDLGKMQFELELMTEGRVYPHHADLVEPEGTFDTGIGDPTLGRGADGFAFGEGFGPYTLAPGEDVRIIMAEGIAGISDEAAVHVGQTYKRRGGSNGADDLLIEFDANGDGVISDAAYDYNTLYTGAERMTKNQWALSAKDSMMQTFQRIEANFESGWNIPKGPLPPARFSVTSGTDRIFLEWESFPGESPAGGWELWRAQNRFDGLPIDPKTGESFEDWPTVYKQVATFGGGETSFEDNDVIRGIDYFYYLQAVGSMNTDATGLTPTGMPLKSNRYYAQTYEPARLKRPPGREISDARVVPNPYNINTDQNLLFSNRDALAFFNIPGECTIKIFTEMGELIREIPHFDGSGDEFWDLQTESLQLVSTGIYFAVIEDSNTGDKVIRKFTIVR
ncbi:MAG: hypothetical protein KTR29_12960 [Rhodothermaceae bacterium]|nr:hypothetical protein [Rhodothermaceae bacterium]